MAIPSHVGFISSWLSQGNPPAALSEHMVGLEDQPTVLQHRHPRIRLRTSALNRSHKSFPSRPGTADESQAQMVWSNVVS